MSLGGRRARRLVLYFGLLGLMIGCARDPNTHRAHECSRALIDSYNALASANRSLEASYRSYKVLGTNDYARRVREESQAVHEKVATLEEQFEGEVCTAVDRSSHGQANIDVDLFIHSSVENSQQRVSEVQWVGVTDSQLKQIETDLDRVGCSFREEGPVVSMECDLSSELESQRDTYNALDLYILSAARTLQEESVNSETATLVEAKMGLSVVKRAQYRWAMARQELYDAGCLMIEQAHGEIAIHCPVPQTLEESYELALVVEVFQRAAIALQIVMERSGMDEFEGSFHDFEEEAHAAGEQLVFLARIQESLREGGAKEVRITAELTANQ